MQEDKLKEFIENNRQEFDDLIPSEAIFSRIEKKIGQKPKYLSFGISNIWKMGVAASILFVIGFTSFWFFQTNIKTDNTLTDISKSTEIILKEVELQNEQKTYVQNEIDADDSREILVPTIKKTILVKDQSPNVPRNKSLTYQTALVLNNSTSASERFQAASKGLENNVLDKEILDVLFNTMQNDPNTNVRMAAFESLSQFANEKRVKNRFISALPIQKDPDIKVAIIDLLSNLRTNSIKAYLEKIASEEDTNPMVIERAHKGLMKLASS